MTIDKKEFLMLRSIQAGKFKANCLKVMSDVSKTKIPIVVTKHHIPLVKIVPVEEKKQSLFGCMKGMVHIKGDIIGPIGEAWNAACNVHDPS